MGSAPNMRPWSQGLRDRSISDELRKADAHGVSVLPRSGHLVVAEQEAEGRWWTAHGGRCESEC